MMFWPQPHPGYGATFWLWAGCIVVYAVSFRRVGRADAKLPTGVYVGLLCILALAAVLRLNRLEDIPANISIDEILPSLEALHIAVGGAPNVFASTGWFNMPNLTFAFPALVLKAVGREGFFAARLSSALMGIGAVLGIFLLGRRLFGDRVGLTASFLCAVSFWHIHNSRTAFPFIQSSFWTVLVLYLLVRAQQDRSRASFAIAGIAFGLALECYFPLRILLLVCPLFWLADWVRNSTPWRTRAADAATFAVGALLVLGPLLMYVPWHVLTGHSEAVLIVRPETLRQVAQSYGLVGFWPVFSRNLQEGTAMFTEWADVCVLNRSPAGLLDLGTLVALIVGVLAAITRGEAMALVMIAWAALTFVFGVALTDSPRASYRLAAAMPALFLLAAFGIDRVLLCFTPRRRWYRLTVWPLLIAAAAVWILTQNYRLFFVEYARGDGRETPDGAVRRWMSSHCDGREFYFVGDWLAMNAPVSQEPHALELFCRDHRPVAAERIPESVEAARPATFLILATQTWLADALRRCYPAAPVTRHRSQEGRLLFISVDVSAADLAAGRACSIPDSSI